MTTARATATATARATELEGLRRVGLLNTLGIHALVSLTEQAKEQSPAAAPPAPAPAPAHVLHDTHKNKVLISKALQSFQAALALLQNGPASQHTIVASSTATATATAGTGTDGVMELQVYPSSELFAPLDCQVNLHNNSVVMYLYNCAIFFQPLADTSGVGCAFYAAILHFNLALTHHISKSTTSTTSTTTAATKAMIHHYKQCLKVLRSIGVGGTRDKNRRPPLPGGGEAMMLLRLAALNKMAHSYYSFKDNSTHTAVSNNKHHIHKAEKTLQRTWRFLVAQRHTLFLSSEIIDTSSFITMMQQEPSMLQPPTEQQPPAQQYQIAQEQDSLEECPPSSSTTNSDRTTRGQEPTPMPALGGISSSSSPSSSSATTATASIMVLHSSNFVYQASINVMVIPTGTGSPPVMGASAA